MSETGNIHADFPLRVIQVVNVRWFNATAWYGLFLSRLLRDAGHEVRILALPGTECFARAVEWGLEPHGLDLNSANPLAVAGLLSSIRTMVREFRPHVVNCHRGESFILWGLAKAMDTRGFGLVRTRGDQRPPKANAANRFAHTRLADQLIVTCSAIETAVRQNLGVPAGRVRAVLGGVDTGRFFPDPEAGRDLRASWGLGPEHTVIGLVGRFDAVKGQCDLIRAFRLLVDSSPESSRLRLVLAGFSTSGTDENEVRAWATEAGIAEQTIFPGRCGNVRALMNALDLGVVASLGSETIARVALELMACGTPLVGTRVGVMPDLLDSWALAAPGDVEGLAALLRRFTEDPQFGQELVRSQTVRMADLDGPHFLRKTLEVYRAAMEHRGPPPGQE